MADDIDVGAAYRELRERVTALLSGGDAGVAAVPVRCCPGWTVKDVAAHLAGVCADILAGRLEGTGSDAWTEAQVSSRRDRSLTEVLDEWSAVGPGCEEIAELMGPAGRQWLFDATTHELDIRSALGDTGGRDTVGISVGLRFVLPRFAGSPEAADAAARAGGPLVVRTGGRDWLAPRPGDGEGDAAGWSAVLEASPFDVVRTFTGRRSADEARRLAWTGDPEPWIDALTWGPFTAPHEDSGEPALA